MAKPLAPVVTICLICGEPLNAKGACLACLLRAGLGESAAETKPSASLVFGDFDVEQRPDGFYWELGHGAMGVTYLAMDKVLRRHVALKVIDVPEAARGSQAVRDRFLREARAAAGLRHPNVAAVFQFGASPDATRCYYAMELVEGETLEARVEREGPLKTEPALEIAIQITRALMAAAAHGLIHRDLKPGNVMLTSANDATTELEVKVIDFGLAKAIAQAGGETDLTHDGFVGTPIFASPEQFGSGPVDARSDIYSLGATLWFALTGLAPRSGSTIQEIRNRHTRDLPVEQLVTRRVPQPVVKLLRSMLAVDPGKRPASARELMEALESCRRKLPHGVGVFYKLSALIAAVAIVAAALFVLRANRQKITSVSASSIAPVASVLTPFPEKSIAVLPFENLSADPENAFFTDGVQDEILNDLAKIADLKVISRTSVMQYKTGVKRNVREIGQQLGVANVVEGSVQRSGNRVRVNAQLVDARTDRQLWGQTYDRDLADVFAIQSEIAKAIANELHAKLSQNERSEIERAPTNDIIAFDLYTRAKQLFSTPSFNVGSKPNLLQAVDLLNQAVARDPSFFRGFCQLAFVHDAFYFFGHDRTSASLALAEAAIQAASRLRPDAGEMHVARAWNLYWGYLDYDGALAELEIARRTLPNDPQILFLTGLIQRRQGHWEESTRTFERAANLDPRNFGVLQNIEGNYATLGRYAEQQLWLGRILAFEPDDAVTKAILAAVDFESRADTQPLHQMIDSVRATNPAAVPDIDHWWLQCALAERDASAATDALNAAREELINLGNDVYCNRPFVEGVIARMAKDDDKARSAFTAARAEQEKIVQAQPNFGPPWCVLGLIDAALGRKEEALREGRRAVELMPVEKDALRGPALIKYLAMIAAWAGDKDLACQQLAIIVRPPTPVTYGQLKLMPFWDPLRGDPRFEKIVASLAPK
jgi:TolB-like protein/Flp pilus assembly protein TadD